MDSDFIAELFAPFGSVTVRRMFGGAGLFREGLMFGLVFDGAIFLKVDDASIPDFEREGSAPFVYTLARSPGRVGRHSLPTGACRNGSTTIPTSSCRGRSARSPSPSAGKRAAQAREGRCEAEGAGTSTMRAVWDETERQDQLAWIGFSVRA